MTIRLLDELSPLEKLSLIDLSYSRLSLMPESGDPYACSAKYFYSYIVKEPRQFGAPAALGNVVHSVLENKLYPNQPIDLDELLREYEIQLGIWDPEHQIDNKLRTVGKDILVEFADRHDGETFDILSKEFPFAIVVGRGLITGYIDRVDFVGNTILVSDYKTGAKEVAAKNIPQNLQLGIYALAINKMYPDYKIYAQMYYLRTGRQKGHQFSADDLKEVELRLLDMISELVNMRDFHPTANERICYYCDFNNGVCPVGTARVSKR